MSSLASLLRIKPRNMRRGFVLLFFPTFFIFSQSILSAAPVPGPGTTPSAAAPEPAPLPEATVSSASGDSDNITLDFKGADINTVLRVMSLKSKINIVAGPEVQGTVTIRLENVPWEKALQVVLRTYGYVYERDGSIIRVTTRENLATEPVETKTFVLNYTKAAEIQSAVQDMLTEKGRIKVAERTNTIVITDIPTNLYNISEIIKRLDRVTPQAFVDSRIVSTSVGITENLGIEWKTGGTSNNLGSLTGSSRPITFPFSSHDNNLSPVIEQFFPVTPSGSTAAQSPENARFFPLAGLASPTNSTYSYGTLNFSSFNAVLQMLKNRATTKVVSNPRIVVLNNQTAEIHVGDNIPLPKFETNQTTGRLDVSGFDYDKLKTGVSLKVTPHINSQREILVDLQPSINSRGDTIKFNTDLSAPIINETTANTQVMIRSGETIAIGGLLTDNTQSAEASVPYLADIPVVGKFFRSKRMTDGSGNAKVETLFFVTVTTVDTEGQPAEETMGTATPAQDQENPADSTKDSSAKKVEGQAQAKAQNAPLSSAASAKSNINVPVKSSSVAHN